jgi:hypothetical protein
MSNEIETTTPTNGEEETVNPETTENEEVVLELEDEETPNEDKDKVIETLKAQKEHWKKKATEKPEPKATPKEQPKAETGLSQTDLFALVKNNVHEDDITDIQDYARMKGLAVKDALKSDFVQSLLRDKEEKRQTAKATNVKPNRSGQQTVSDETIVNNARSKGEIPESDSDVEKIVKSRLGIK